jgi:hypothetical protein
MHTIVAWTGVLCGGSSIVSEPGFIIDGLSD